MLRLIGNDAHLVTYGAMAKAPLSLPAGPLIFQNLTAHGFWQNKWYASRNYRDRRALYRELTDLIRDGKVRYIWAFASITCCVR
jgi:mitochondrial enoyl-[acyl-carrier protein] reductase / trans-2-enoyl-CoA reductase